MLEIGEFGSTEQMCSRCDRLAVNPGLQTALDVHCGCRRVDPARGHEQQRGKRP